MNRARSYIFTTASTPADAAAALAALRGRAVARGRRAARRGCAPTSTGCARATRRRSCPYVCGDEARALDGRRRRSLDAGLLVPAIRPPTVPPGTSRLRVALSAAHTAEQVDRLADALARALPASMTA